MIIYYWTHATETKSPTSSNESDLAMLCNALSSIDLKEQKSDHVSIFWIFGSWLSFTKK